MSARKPFNGDAGYLCSLRASFGHVVVYDRAPLAANKDSPPGTFPSP